MIGGDDWQVGDLALCLCNFRGGDEPCVRPRAGQLATVVAVAQGRTKLGLVLKECPNANPYGWAASRFRKIRPHTPDAEDRRTIELLTGKPAKVRA